MWQLVVWGFSFLDPSVRYSLLLLLCGLLVVLLFVLSRLARCELWLVILVFGLPIAYFADHL